MKQELLEVSDGKLYGNNDMAKISCHDCKGCSSCCEGMGDSIWLDPYDVFQLTHNLKKPFSELLEKEVELHVEEGLILPNLRMSGTGEGSCGFLNTEGRCTIHAFRPGLCRLFPLGRDYTDGKLNYFVLKDACPAPNKSKVKIHKWLNVPRIGQYEEFLCKWHGLTKELRRYLTDHTEDEAMNKAINMRFLQIFYMDAYVGDDFYEAFEGRYREMKELLGI